MARASGGAFDPTIGPVGRLWRRTRRNRQLPDPEQLRKARLSVGYDAIELNPKDRTVRLTKPGMKLDFGGIAKGFACDEAMAALQKAGIASALVAGAGDIRVADPPPGQAGWRVGVAAPDGSPEEPVRMLSVKNCAVSTSGDAERYVEIDGVRYGHILDPRTGAGSTLRASLTVVAKDGATADCLATAAFVLGPEAGIRLIDRLGASGLFVVAGSRPGTFASRLWAENLGR
jgi:thiamine biosynthesis lipoprotein